MNEELDRLVDIFIGVYVDKGFHGVYKFRDNQKLTGRNSVYFSLIERVVDSFEKSVSNGSHDRFHGITELKAKILEYFED